MEETVFNSYSYGPLVIVVISVQISLESDGLEY